MGSILVVEDDPRMGEMVVGLLERAGYAVTLAVDARGGQTAFRTGTPDLVLLDIMLPDRSGLELLAELRQSSRVPVLLLTARGEAEDRVLGLDLGADDYLSKPFWNEELLARIRALLRRQAAAPAGPRVRSFGAVRVDVDARQVQVAERPVRLTPTEFELLSYLLERAGRAIRREQLLAALPGEERTENGLQTQISRLRARLGRDGARIKTVWGIGYMLDLGAPT